MRALVALAVFERALWLLAAAPLCAALIDDTHHVRVAGVLAFHPGRDLGLPLSSIGFCVAGDSLISEFENGLPTTCLAPTAGSEHGGTAT